MSDQLRSVILILMSLIVFIGWLMRRRHINNCIFLTGVAGFTLLMIEIFSMTVWPDSKALIILAVPLLCIGAVIFTHDRAERLKAQVVKHGVYGIAFAAIASLAFAAGSAIAYEVFGRQELALVYMILAGLQLVVTLWGGISMILGSLKKELRGGQR